MKNEQPPHRSKFRRLVLCIFLPVGLFLIFVSWVLWLGEGKAEINPKLSMPTRQNT